MLSCYNEGKGENVNIGKRDEKGEGLREKREEKQESTRGKLEPYHETQLKRSFERM